MASSKLVIIRQTPSFPSLETRSHRANPNAHLLKENFPTDKPGGTMSREVVVITGASAGIGRATARLFGKKGASVGLIARGKEALNDARREIESAGGKALVLPLDIADSGAVE